MISIDPPIFDEAFRTTRSLLSFQNKQNHCFIVRDKRINSRCQSNPANIPITPFAFDSDHLHLLHSMASSEVLNHSRNPHNQVEHLYDSLHSADRGL